MHKVRCSDTSSQIGICAGFISNTTHVYCLYCLPSFIGDNCEEDFDACGGDPCGPARCLDATPEEEQNTTIQYTCAGCPDGYELDELEECAGNCHTEEALSVDELISIRGALVGKGYYAKI